MKEKRAPTVASPRKAPTGITGVDDLTGGGLPHGRTTMLVGGVGTGKTIFGLQFLAHGAQACGEPGIFVAFEETSQRIMTNAASFGWNLPALLRRKQLHFVDVQPLPDMVQAGDFDLLGMLAGLEKHAKTLKVRRIVFDALDVLLDLLPDIAAKRREAYRLNQWLVAHNLTGLVTAKASGAEALRAIHEPFGFMQYMVDCTVLLTHSILLGMSQRRLRVEKYRGSGFNENELPFVISPRGIEGSVAHESDPLDG